LDWFIPLRRTALGVGSYSYKAQQGRRDHTHVREEAAALACYDMASPEAMRELVSAAHRATTASAVLRPAWLCVGSREGR